MKQVFLLAFSIFLGSFSVLAEEEELPKLRIGDEAPKLVSFDIFGDTFNSDELRGDKLILVSFFGTYCRPCIAEFPEIIEIYKKHRGYLQVVMVNKGMEGRDQLKVFQNDHGLDDFTILRDRFGKIGDPYGVNAVPVTIIIGKDRKILLAQYGAFKKGELVKTLDPLIEGAK